ncbi:unnamed protein product [Clonostachys rosea]|uniref:Uncharacterized protein n=1 Tax=Bionectria ochroleuca TaxID=29856 RepID=A0ABY6UE07_BIOOC|nr:unnamed protein product [Clonostachys rosea]
MFETFQSIVAYDAQKNGEVKDGGNGLYQLRLQLGYHLKREENHEKWKAEANSPFISPILATIYPFNQRYWQSSLPGRKGYSYYRFHLTMDILLVPLTMIWVDVFLMEDWSWQHWRSRLIGI